MIFGVKELIMIAWLGRWPGATFLLAIGFA
jgi:hypothetical protein